MVEPTAELDHDTLRLLEAGDFATLAMDVATCRQLLAEIAGKSIDEINVLLAGRHRLKAINTELVEALECAERWMMRLTDEVLDGEGCRPEYAEDCKTVRAAIAKATKEPDDG